MTEPSTRSAQHNQSVTRAATLLRCFIDAPHGATLSDLARRTGIHVSTAHRILGTLVEAGLLARGAGERYQPGVALLALAGAAFSTSGLAAAHTILTELTGSLGESASLAVPDQDCAVVMLEVEAPARLRFAYGPGARLSLHDSAHGQALLAFDPDPEAALGSLPGPLVAASGTAFVDRKALLSELGTARRRGFTVVHDTEQGVVSMATPVRSDDGQVRCTLGVAAPAHRLTAARTELAGSRLQEAVALVAALPLRALGTPPASQPRPGGAQ